MNDNKKVDRPSFIEDEYLDYLDIIRKTGVTNMFGTTPYLKNEYPELNTRQASQVLFYWMETFE